MKLDKILIQIGAACLLALPPAIHGQTGKSPAPVKTSVGDVTDNRTTGSFFFRMQSGIDVHRRCRR